VVLIDGGARASQRAAALTQSSSPRSRMTRRPSTTLSGRFLSAVKGIAAVLGGLGSRPLASPAVPGATPVGMGGAVD